MNPGYLFLLMTLFFGTSKGFCGKKISGAVHGVRPALAFNALRMAFCVLIGLVILLITGETLAASGRMLGIAALNGVSTADILQPKALPGTGNEKCVQIWRISPCSAHPI